MSFKNKALAGAVALSIGASGYVFSARSIGNIQEVHPDLQLLTQCALDKSTTDFVVVDGKRTLQEHWVNVRNGRSWTNRSRHVDGMAVDFAAYVGGKITYEPKYYYNIGAAFFVCSEKHDIPIIWGGDWRVRDYMHIELDRRRYPSPETAEGV